MKKFFLFLATLMLGFGQLFADEVTFSVSDLMATLPEGKKISLPYAWKPSPYHVTATIANADDTPGDFTVANPMGLKGTHKITVAVAGEGSVNGVKFTTSPASQKVNATASTGSYASGTWTPGQNEKTNTVTFTCTGDFRLTKIVVDYTPDEGHIPDVPVTGGEPLVGPFEATPIKSIDAYNGTDPYVFDMAGRKYYALNNLGEYEEFGLYPEVNTLKVAGATAVQEIEYIKTNTSMSTIPYINLNYIPKANSKAVCTLQAETGPNWKAIYGCGYFDNGWKDRFCFFTTNATINLGGETGDKEKMAYGRKIVTVLDAGAGKMDIFEADGTTLIGTITDSPKTADCKTPLYVFAQNKDVPGGGKTTDCRNAYATLYGLQIYEGETMVMDLVPAVNSEGKGGLKDKLTGDFYAPVEGEFELSADGQAMASDAGITVYPGKLVVNTADNHEYNWNGTEWVDLGSVYKPIAATNYQDMRREGNGGGWKCRFGYDATYNNITNEGNNNFFNPYKGEGGWEPYQCTIAGLTKGETYRVSFNFTSNGWDSWSSYTQIPVFVTNNENFGRELVPSGASGAVLGFVGLPQAAMTNHPYSFTFTADGTEAVMAIQFGVGNDGKDFYFHFDDLKIEFVDYPQKYDIDWVDPNKYTALEYIESTGAARENVFTTPYYFKASSEIDTKFQSYGNGGWRAIFCGRNGSDSGISLYQNGNGVDFGYFVGGYVNDNHAPYPGHNQDITVAASLGNLNVNGTDYSTGRKGFNASTNQVSLFANPGNDNPFRGRIYYFTIKEGDETVYDFQPVMRHDGAFGYYDKATKTFLTPVRGNWDGYGFGKLENQSYLTYNKETRVVVVGSTAQFLPDAQNLDGATYTWTSSDESKATVAADGTVTGKAAGKVTITVTTDADQGWTASYELTVAEPNYVRRDANGVGYAIVTGGNGWGDSPLSALLDNNASTKFGCSNSSDAWAIMIASEPVAVQQYSFVTGADTYGYPGRNPVSWKLEGSNDNQTWTVIDEQVKSYKLQAKNKEEFEFFVNGTETYKFFKFSATQLGDGFQMGEFWINAQAHNYAENAELRVEATCTKDGQVVYECDDCHALLSKPIEKAPHTYVDGVCKVCSAKIAEITLLPTRGDDNTPYYAKFRYAEGVSDAEYVDIEDGWNTVDFDDSAWGELMMPLGSFGPYHTRWIGDYNTFWFRRGFYVENPATITKLTLKVTHDDDCAVFLNGTKVFQEYDWTGGENDFRVIDVDPSLLVEGNNVLAMYIEQNWGGAYCDFGLEANVGATVEVSDAKYATFVAPVDVDFTGANVAAKAATFDGTYVQLKDVTKVPAGTAVVVNADEGTYTVPATTDADLGAENELIASNGDGVKATGTQYILANQEGKVGFAKATPDTEIPAGKGYLVITGEAGVKAFYPFEGEDATGIESLTPALSEGEGAIYNVAGQKMSKLQKGINIINGKKVLF